MSKHIWYFRQNSRNVLFSTYIYYCNILKKKMQHWNKYIQGWWLLMQTLSAAAQAEFEQIQKKLKQG